MSHPFHSIHGVEMRTAAEALLRRLTGDPAAAFRDGQWDAIEQLVVHWRRALVVQRTGWGKSAVYFLATRLLRDAGGGPTLLVSPLLALMRNQLDTAARAGIRAATINSDNRDDWDDIEARVARGDVDILLISPERLNNDRFRRDVLPALARTVGLLVVDEAHCISDWGHDFRPDYRRIARVLQLLPRTVPVLCTTATANDRVVADIVEQLGEGLHVLRGPLDRESLALGVVDLPQPAERLAWLATVLPTLPGSGIVYCLTVAQTETVARWLVSQGIDAVAYSGQSDSGDRVATEADLLSNDVKVVVATSALGMGFDKPDLTFVVHYGSPGSAIAYYQQVGRAGRGVDRAVGVLLRGTEDTDIQDWFIRTAFPSVDHAQAIVGLLEAQDEPMTIADLEREVNVRRSRIADMLKVLEVEGAVERQGRGWQRTLQPWAYDAERVARVTALRREEQAQMIDYGRTTACRMAFLRAALDDREARPCGRCDNCTGTTWAVALDRPLVAAAIGHLRSSSFVIDVRKRWPNGLGEPAGVIPTDRQAEPGRALGVYGDGGWGSVVKEAKYGAHHYPDQLVDAAVHLVTGWAPAPPPAWVTCVPSTTSAGIVASFAARLAERLGVPFEACIERRRSGRPQKEMDNSPQQVRNVYGAFQVTTPVPPGPVLLLDDIVDSRWTLTVVADLLREAGAGPVHPFVLAKALSS